MKKSALKLSFVLMTACILTACQKTDVYEDSAAPGTPLTIYTIGEGVDSVIVNYNEQAEAEDRIEVISFDDGGQMEKQLISDIMAGKGPDLIRVNSTMTSLNINKIISSNYLADINVLIDNDKGDNKIDISDYNKIIMDSGVTNGKRLFAPISYGLNAFLVPVSLSEKFNIDTTAPFTYDNIKDRLSSYIEAAGSKIDKTTILGLDQMTLDAVYHFTDYKNKTTNLDSPEFKKVIEQIDNLYLSKDTVDAAVETQLNAYILYINMLNGGNITAMQNRYNTLKDDMAIVRPIAFEDSQITAFVTDGVAINKNSAQKNKAFKFVKFALSEEALKSPIGGLEYGLSVKNDTVEKQLDNITEGNFEPIIQEPTSYLVGISKENIAVIKDMINSIDKCVIRDSYESLIFYPEYYDYLEGKNSIDNFISNLISKTKIYLTE